MEKNKQANEYWLWYNGQASPLEVKKFYVLAALEVEAYRASILTSQVVPLEIFVSIAEAVILLQKQTLFEWVNWHSDLKSLQCWNGQPCTSRSISCFLDKDKVSNLLGQHWGCMKQAHMSHSKPLLGKTAAATTLEGLIQVALWACVQCPLESELLTSLSGVSPSLRMWVV